MALDRVRLEAIVVGSVAAVLNGAPIMTDFIGDSTATVAALDDVIASKEAAGRPKDLAQLPILRETLRVRKTIEAKS